MDATSAAISAVEDAGRPLAKQDGESEMARFEVGRTYSTRSICDYDCIFSFRILARTAKTVSVKVNDKIVRRGLSLYDGDEEFKPYGSYSMCAVIRAH
jgi:hypothetical protein